MPICSTVSGALLELSALGNPDVHAYCNPEASLWIQSFKRITNYAIAEQDVCFNSAPSGAWTAQTCVKAEVQRAGDLVMGAYFVARLSALPNPTAGSFETDARVWTPAVGFALIQQARLCVGSQEVEKFGGEYMMMHDEVHKREGKRSGMAVGDYGEYLRSGFAQASHAAGAGLEVNPNRGDEDTLQRAIEYSTRDQQLYVHIPFHFAGHPGNALNIVGLQQHRVDIELDIRARSDLIIDLDANRQTGEYLEPGTLADSGGEMSEAKLRILYVHLDTPERRHRAQMPATIMFVYPQTQEISAVAGDSGTTKEVRNYHNHPVIDWLFSYRSDESTTALRWNQFGALRGLKNVSTVGFFAPQEVFDPFEEIQIDLNSHTRLCVRADYLRLAVPAQRLARVPSRIVYDYPLALDPCDESGPPGSLNLSRVDNVVLKFKFRSVGQTDETIGALKSDSAVQVDTDGSTAGKIFWHARTINYYKQQGGMFGILYAN